MQQVKKGIRDFTLESTQPTSPMQKGLSQPLDTPSAPEKPQKEEPTGSGHSKPFRLCALRRRSLHPWEAPCLFLVFAPRSTAKRQPQTLIGFTPTRVCGRRGVLWAREHAWGHGFRKAVRSFGGLHGLRFPRATSEDPCAGRY